MRNPNQIFENFETFLFEGIMSVNPQKQTIISISVFRHIMVKFTIFKAKEGLTKAQTKLVIAVVANIENTIT